jgi:hypothetical protein
MSDSAVAHTVSPLAIFPMTETFPRQLISIFHTPRNFQLNWIFLLGTAKRLFRPNAKPKYVREPIKLDKVTFRKV